MSGQGKPPAMNPDYADLLQELSGVDARFMLVGAYALAVHGRPRATGDFDVWVEASQENAPKVFEALRRFGAPLNDLTTADLEKSGLIFQMGVVPRRIDVITSIDGVAFQDAWPNRVVVDMAGLKVPCIGRKDLIKNKRASGRTQDIADVEALELIPE